MRATSIETDENHFAIEPSRVEPTFKHRVMAAHHTAMSTVTGSSSTTTVQEGATIKVIQHWSQMSDNSRYMLGGYALIGLGVAAFLTYRSGSRALAACRSKGNNSFPGLPTTAEQARSEWEAVSEDCRKHSWDHIWWGVTWPATLVRSVMPSLIIRFNPRD